MFIYLNKYNIPLETGLERTLGSHKAIKLSNLVNEHNKHLAANEAIDLLERMLNYDHVTNIDI